MQILKKRNAKTTNAFCRQRFPAALYETMLDGGGQYKEATNWLRWYVDRPPFRQISAARLRSSNQYLHLATLAHRENQCAKSGVSELAKKEGRRQAGRGKAGLDGERRRRKGEGVRARGVAARVRRLAALEIGGKLN